METGTFKLQKTQKHQKKHNTNMSYAQYQVPSEAMQYACATNRPNLSHCLFAKFP